MSDGGRPPAAPPADVLIALGGAPLGQVRVDTGFKPYALAIPPALAADLAARREPVQVRIETTPWVPEQVLGTPDDRALGIMVDRVTVR
jgi:hypothetical protein